MRIPTKIHDELLAHAREDAPNECCGLIGGTDGIARTVYRARNAEASPLRYNLDPQDQFRIMTEMDERGEELSAIYHSHTASPAYPSQTSKKSTSNRSTDCMVPPVSCSTRGRICRAFASLRSLAASLSQSVTPRAFPVWRSARTM